MTTADYLRETAGRLTKEAIVLKDAGQTDSANRKHADAGALRQAAIVIEDLEKQTAAKSAGAAK